MLNNNEMFTSPEKCISECDKQIEFANNLIIYLQQYIKQLEAMKVMAQSAKAFQEVNPFKMMMQFVESMNSLTPNFNNETKPNAKHSKSENDEECE
jgi:hypothetical protein